MMDDQAIIIRREIIIQDDHIKDKLGDEIVDQTSDYMDAPDKSTIHVEPETFRRIKEHGLEDLSAEEILKYVLNSYERLRKQEAENAQ